MQFQGGAEARSAEVDDVAVVALAEAVRGGVSEEGDEADSIAAIKGFPMLGEYSASKFAARGLTQVAAQLIATHGSTVTAWAVSAWARDRVRRDRVGP